MSNATQLEVALFAPDASVTSMLGGAMATSVEEAATAAKTAYAPLAIKKSVQVRSYSNNFEGAVDAAIKFATTYSLHQKLAVIITDLDYLQGDRLGEKLGSFLSDWMHGVMVVVPVGSLAEGLRLETRLPNLDFIQHENLGNYDAATAKIHQFFAEQMNFWPEWIRPYLPLLNKMLTTDVRIVEAFLGRCGLYLDVTRLGPLSSS